MIDPQRYLAAPPVSARTTWDPTDVILHHLGTGATGRDLRYVYERGLVVLPSFATVLAQTAARALVASLPGGIDPSTLVHGEHELVCRRPLDPAGSASSVARVESLWDRGAMAVLVVRVDTGAADGEHLAVNRYHLLLPGQGGFGGEHGAPPRRMCVLPPESPGPRVLTTSIHAQQPAIFRLSGDRAPLHIDPAAARALGFASPPLAGLCTFGTVLRVALDALADGDVGRFVQFRARFTGAVHPGDGLAVRADGNGFCWQLATSVPERSASVLERAQLLLLPEPADPDAPDRASRAAAAAAT